MHPARVRFACRCAALALLTLTMRALPAVAQTPSLVTDLASSAPWSVSPALASDLFPALGKLFFSGAGNEPAVADAAGTGSELLADLCPGDCGSYPQFLGTVGSPSANVVLFTASPDSSAVARLYRTDGTRAGTYSLGVSLPFVGFGPPPLPTQAFLGGIFFFPSCAGEVFTHCDLWRTDGSLAGTRRIKDLAPNPADFLKIGSVTAVGSKIFFFLSINNHIELWASDGTEAHTARLQAFPDPDFPVALAGGTSHLYFFALAPAGTSSANSALWASDGTASGTAPVTAFPGTSPFSANALSVLGDRAYFVANDIVHGDEIWASDGTLGSTRRVTDFGNASPFSYLSSFPNAFSPVELGSRLVFVATDGLHGTQLWSSRGTPESTALLPVPEQVDPRSLTLRDGRGLFWATSGGIPGGFNQPLELWSTDGTPAGTQRLVPTCTGSCILGRLPSLDGGVFLVGDLDQIFSLWTTDGTPAGTRAFSDPILRSASDSIDTPQPVSLAGRLFFALPGSDGTELWTSDGQPGGTRPVPGLTDGGSTAPRDLAVSGGALFFTACDGASRQVYQTAGTPATTVLRSSFADATGRCGDDSPRGLTALGGAVFFWHLDQSHDLQELWRLNAAGGGPQLLGAIPDTSSQGVPPPLTPFGTAVYFPAPGPNGLEVWTSDGTPAGTGAATALAAIPSPAVPEATAGGLLYLLASPGSGAEIWASDGTAAGTRRLVGGLDTLLSAPPFAAAGPWTFFVASDSARRSELWRTDGTAAGTSPVADFSGDPTLAAFTAYQGNLFFFASTATGRGLFRSDGTAAGTVLVQEFPPISPLFPSFLTVFAGRLFFVADDGIHGRELWSSDGTPAGTTLVREVSPGPASAAVADLTVVGSRLYFSAADPLHGAELWQTDGTAAGTRLAADLAPESASSSPESLTAVGERLYFVADDGIAGRELWKLDTAATPACQTGDTRLCLGAGRFQVEAEWMDFQGNTGVGHAVSLTADTGYFWFFAPTNVETVVKVLDGRGLNGAFWVFYGALSNVSYTLTVTDTATGLSRRYVNPPGVFASVGDTDGFGPLGAYDDAKVSPSPSPGFALVSARTDARAATGTCTPGAQRLCLQGDRFAVTAAWQDFQGKTGTGTAVSLTPDTGYFWFFDPANVEVVTKVLDGTGLNGKFWFFYGALSDVAYTLTVTDTQTGAVKTYKNPSGQFGSLGDTGAF